MIVFYRATLLTLLAAFLVGTVSAAPVKLRDLRLWHSPEGTRLVFDISAPVEQHRLFQLDNPARVVIDLSNVEFDGRLPKAEATGPLIKRIRSGRPDSRRTRFVLDLAARVSPKSFQLRPSGGYGHRLVIDVQRRYTKVSRPPPKAAPKRPGRKEFVIAIDAGHGGEDFGAIGLRKTAEKHVVLQIAHRLRRLVDQGPGMRSVMVRTGDYYVSLRRRLEIARQNRADLFVSIHADAFPNRKVRGSSVYALSQRGASSETAKWLAERENKSDLAGGIALNQVKDSALAFTLLDLAMTQTIKDSLDLGDEVLGQLKRVGKVHSRRVEQAGFVVLKSPDIPSILVETAYISNPTEEKLLRSSRYQDKIARAIFNGLKQYARSQALLARR